MKGCGYPPTADDVAFVELGRLVAEHLEAARDYRGRAWARILAMRRFSDPRGGSAHRFAAVDAAEWRRRAYAHRMIARMLPISEGYLPEVVE